MKTSPILFSALLVACSGGGAESTPERRTDTGSDLDTAIDTAADTASDTDSDTATDTGTDTDTDTASTAANEVAIDGVTIVLDGVINLNDGGGFALYTGATADWSTYVQLTTVSVVGGTACGANAYVTMSVTTGGATYAATNAGSTCTIDVTSAATASGQHYSGTYEADLRAADGSSIAVTGGRFDAVYP
jgi:hypothetical protein